MNQAIAAYLICSIAFGAAVTRTDTYTSTLWADPIGTTGNAGLAVKDVLFGVVAEQYDDHSIKVTSTMTVNLKSGKSIGAAD